ncbi:hypothetical protein DOTSEDRAFT_48822 [Dothistroma septosporum NZE10]|uniref:Uncharacterized protein n=1 Tax=Dothistroma septosporum (strain NZE10 / CBS 128990) TaxID=675120 RepID=M2XZT7_DOTSN|nr:hypothetical protein DOTSEDRAFT_48822 [Dothistroma septosporum NZE10]
MSTATYPDLDSAVLVQRTSASHDLLREACPLSAVCSRTSCGAASSSLGLSVVYLAWLLEVSERPEEVGGSLLSLPTRSDCCRKISPHIFEAVPERRCVWLENSRQSIPRKHQNCGQYASLLTTTQLGCDGHSK